MNNDKKLARSLAKAKRLLQQGDDMREENLTNTIQAMEVYEQGIAELEQHPSFEKSDEALKVMVSLKDIYSTCLHLGVRCGLMGNEFPGTCFGAPDDAVANANLAANCRKIIVCSTYVLNHREHASEFQIKKCRSKRMGCAQIVEAKLGKRQSLTQAERELALEDANMILTNGDAEFSITYENGDEANWLDMAQETKIAMGEPNLEVCANIMKCKNKDKAEKKLMRCTRCKSVVYCGRDCQVNHFADHKKVCKRIAAKNNLVLVD